MDPEADGDGHLTPMRLQTLSLRGFVVSLSVFFACLIVSVLIGAFGPSVVDSHSVSTWQCPAEDIHVFDPSRCSGKNLAAGQMWTGIIEKLDRLNQQVVMVANVLNVSPNDISTTLIWEVDIAGREGVGKPWTLVEDGKEHSRAIKCKANSMCKNITLVHEPFVQYADYQVNVTLKADSGDPALSPQAWAGDIAFTFELANPSFTLFELWFRFVFLLFNFVALVLFAFTLRARSWRQWTVEQKWTLLLLFGLMGFNDPFFPLGLLVGGWLPVLLDQLLVVSFVSFLLVFWLIMFDGLRKFEPEQRSFVRFYLPKLFFVALFWIAALTLFVWTELHEMDDPSYGTIVDVAGYAFVLVVTVVWGIVYLFAVLFLVFRACGDSRAIPYLSERTKFFGLYTLLVVLITVSGIIFNFLGPVKNNAAQLLSFLSLLNFYVYVLAFMYGPALTGGQGVIRNVSDIDLTDGAYAHLQEDDVLGVGDDDDDVGVLRLRDESDEDEEEGIELDSMCNESIQCNGLHVMGTAEPSRKARRTKYRKLRFRRFPAPAVAADGTVAGTLAEWDGRGSDALDCSDGGESGFHHAKEDRNQDEEEEEDILFAESTNPFADILLEPPPAPVADETQLKSLAEQLAMLQEQIAMLSGTASTTSSNSSSSSSSMDSNMDDTQEAPQPMMLAPPAEPAPAPPTPVTVPQAPLSSLLPPPPSTITNTSSSSSPSPSPSSSSSSTTSPSTSSSMIIAPPPTMLPPPPPPPPPTGRAGVIIPMAAATYSQPTPPPPPQRYVGGFVPGVTMGVPAQQLKQHQQKQHQQSLAAPPHPPPPPPPPPTLPPMSLAAVMNQQLSRAETQPLRPVASKPSTPLRSATQPVGTADFLAAALQKRFQTVRAVADENDSPNQSSAWDSTVDWETGSPLGSK